MPRSWKDPDEVIAEKNAEIQRLSNLWQIEHDHATALRAQIDRERAATIEAAAKVAESAGMSLKPAAGWAERDVVWWETGGLDHILAATDAIRALHTDATRAAMDAIWREGYEAGAVVERAKSADLANAARDLADCCQLGEDEDWEEGEDPLSELRAVLAAMQKGKEG